ncbi:MAG: barstar family protein [Clostridia bacterium]|nr:barstar family protein [Clostridia bacterium]MBR6647513.1 barstar family protein [Clostridia bacterium]
MKEHDESYYEFKEIKENPIIIDFAGLKHWEIYPLLKEKFGLPECCGENTSALWDFLWDIFYGEGEYEVKIYGYNSLKGELKEYCREILGVFNALHKETPNVTFEIIS